MIDVVRVRVALVVGLMLMVVSIGVVLTRSPTIVGGSDFTPLDEPFAETYRSTQACQGDEVMPKGTSALRLSLFARYGPPVTVKVLSGDRVVTRGMVKAGWIGEGPTVPVSPIRRNAFHVKVCFALGQMDGRLKVIGEPAGSTGVLTSDAGQQLGGRLRIEYLKPGDRSWLSQVSSVARRMGLGRWASGTWIVLLIFVMVASVVVGATWLTVRELQ
jgi:hypothetical protein